MSINIQEVENKLRSLSRVNNVKNAKEIFELGIAVGKDFEGSVGQEISSSFWDKRIESLEETERFFAKKKKIDDLLLNVVRFAIKAQVEAYGVWVVAESGVYDYDTAEFDLSAMSKGNLRVRSTYMQGENGAYLVKLTACGALQEILEMHSICKTFEVEIDNINGEEFFEFSDEDLVDDCLISCATVADNIDESKLDELYEKLTKQFLFQLLGA